MRQDNALLKPNDNYTHYDPILKTFTGVSLANPKELKNANSLTCTFVK